jgi:hypothetical protein
MSKANGKGVSGPGRRLFGIDDALLVGSIVGRKTPSAADRHRQALTIRLRPDTRKRIEASAVHNCRSLAREVEFRLMRDAALEARMPFTKGDGD